MSALLLGNGDGALGAPVVSVNANGKVHCVFRGTDARIHYRRWNGSGWDADEIVPSPALKNYQPHVAAEPGGRANVVFVGETGQGSSTYAIFFTERRKTKWSDPVQLSNESYAQLPRMAIAADGSIHVVYNRFGQTFQEIYYTRFDGSAWSAPQIIGSGFSPDLALDANGEIQAVWNDKTDLYTAHRSANGTWSAPERIKAGQKPQTACITFDLAGGGHLIAQARAGDNQKLVHAQRAADGTFPKAKAIAAGNLILTMYPRVAVDCANHLHLVFQGKTTLSGSEPWRVYECVWDGTSWSAPARLDKPAQSFINQVPGVHAFGTVLATTWWARNGTSPEMYADVQTLDCAAPVSMSMEPPKPKAKPKTTKGKTKPKAKPKAKSAAKPKTAAKRKTSAKRKIG